MFIDDATKQHILDAKLYITADTGELEDEIDENMFYLAGTGRAVAATPTAEILDFLRLVKEDRRRQLDASDVETDLIYYLWHDELAGQLRFNFINANHPSLPFGCNLNLAVTEADIVEKFKSGDTLDGIPLDGMVSIAVNDEGKAAEDICDDDFDMGDEEDDRDSDIPDEFASSEEANSTATGIAEPLGVSELLMVDDECGRREFVLDVYSERIARTGLPRG